jgi:cytochrome c peroxidase
MHIRVRLSIAHALGGLIFQGVVGCTGDGGAPPLEAEPLVQQASSVAKPATASQKGAGQSAAGEAQVTTPARSIDPKQLTDVVREEVKGGEATEGPTPFDHLWQPSKTELIKDEPLVVTVPVGLQPLTPKIYVPAANPITKGKYELGRQLYFEPRVSLNGTVSCATCHNPAKGWTDKLPVSIGISGQTGGRSAPSVLNAVYGKTMFWDGRAPSLEGQSQGPPQNPIEMGEQSYKDIVDRLRKVTGYTEHFKKVFGTDVTLDGMAKAIATFERVAALSGNSKYDKYAAAGDNKAMSDSEKRGMVLFGLTLNTDDEFKTDVVRQKAKCTLCHQGFNFTDEQFHNLGVGWNEKTGKFADLGRWAIDPIGAKHDADLGAFKTPTVRDVEGTAPYMHDGSLATLEEVVDHYDKGGIANPALDPDMKKLGLTAEEKKDVVAFMRALSGESRKLEELLPKLPPDAEGKSPDPRLSLTPPSKTVASIPFHPALTR